MPRWRYLGRLYQAADFGRLLLDKVALIPAVSTRPPSEVVAPGKVSHSVSVVFAARLIVAGRRRFSSLFRAAAKRAWAGLRLE